MLAFADTPDKTLTKVELTKCELASIEDCDNEIRCYGSATDKDKNVSQAHAIARCKLQLELYLHDIIWNSMLQYINRLYLNWDKMGKDAVSEIMESKCRRAVEKALTVCSESNILPNGEYESGICLTIPTAYAEIIAGHIITELEINSTYISPESKQLRTSAYESLLNHRLKKARSDRERDEIRKSLDRLHSEQDHDSDPEKTKIRDEYMKELERFRQQQMHDSTP